jgi:hypothetical protein
VTPRGDGVPAEPIYFLRHDEMPPVPATELSAQFSGSVLAGHGFYDVAATVFDDQHRVCRAEWRVRVDPLPQVRAAISEIPPNRIAKNSTTTSRQPSTAVGRLTILLHAASAFPRVSVLPDADVRMLTDALAAVIEHMPAREVRLVMFSLREQKELYRKTGFTMQDLDNATKALASISPTVDIQAMPTSKGALDMLGGVLHRELTNPAPPDMVLFMGPPGPENIRIPAKAVRADAGIAPHVFYVEFAARYNLRRYPRGFAPPDSGIVSPSEPYVPGSTPGCGPDVLAADTSGPVPCDIVAAQISAENNEFNAIRITVTALKGKTFLIRRPEDFAKALREIESTVSHRR